MNMRTALLCLVLLVLVAQSSDAVELPAKLIDEAAVGETTIPGGSLEQDGGAQASIPMNVRPAISEDAIVPVDHLDAPWVWEGDQAFVSSSSGARLVSEEEAGRAPPLMTMGDSDATRTQGSGTLGRNAEEQGWQEMSEYLKDPESVAQSTARENVIRDIMNALRMQERVAEAEKELGETKAFVDAWRNTASKNLHDQFRKDGELPFAARQAVAEDYARGLPPAQALMEGSPFSQLHATATQVLSQGIKDRLSLHFSSQLHATATQVLSQGIKEQGGDGGGMRSKDAGEQPKAQQETGKKIPVKGKRAREEEQSAGNDRKRSKRLVAKSKEEEEARK